MTAPQSHYHRRVVAYKASDLYLRHTHISTGRVACVVAARSTPIASAVMSLVHKAHSILAALELDTLRHSACLTALAEKQA
jgi:hypothetical protein